MEPLLFDLNLQLIVDAAQLLIAVFFLFLALSFLLFNPAKKLLQGRREKIKEELDTAEKNMQDAEKLKEEYDTRLKEVNIEAEKILNEARKKALANESRMIEEAKEESARIIERAKVEADLEKKKVADEVKEQMVVVAALMAQKVVAASIDTKVQDTLLDETLKEIGDSTWLS